MITPAVARRPRSWPTSGPRWAGPGAHRADRARPVPARRLEHGGRRLRSSASRRRPTRCRPACRPPRRHGRAVRRPRLGHGPGRRRRAARRRGRDRHDEDEPGAVGRPRRPAGVGRAGRAQPRPHHGSWRQLRPALRARPVEPAELLDRRQRGQQLRRAALPRRRRHQRPRPRPSRSCCPTATSPCSAARTPSPTGYDLRGAFVGSEGMLGIATRICVRLTQNPPAVRTLLLDFDRVDDGAATVSAIIAAGMVPAALEMMDALHHPGRRGLRPRRLPDRRRGHPASSRSTACPARRRRRRSSGWREIGRAHGARTVRVAADEAERALIWKGRKTRLRRHRPDQAELLPARHGRAPARASSRCCAQVYEIAARHELHRDERVPRRRRQPAPAARVRQARAGRAWSGSTPPARRSCGSASPPAACCPGEHGIGLEKRDLMPLHVRPGRPRRRRPACGEAFDPDGVANPDKVLPAGSRCGDLQHVPGGRVDLTAFAAEVGPAGPVTCVGARRQWDVGGPVAAGHAGGARRRPGSTGSPPEEMTVGCGAGHHRSPSSTPPSPSGASWSPCRTGGTVGGVLAVGRSGVRRLGYGPVRDTLLQAGVRHRGRRGGEGGRPDGQERQRLRPVPAAGRVARHARPSSATSSCAPAPARRRRRLVSRRRRRRPVRAVPARCTGRVSSSGTARRPGCCWKATPATSRRQAAEHRLDEVDRPADLPPAAGRRCRRPTCATSPARSWPRSASASCTATSPSPARAPSPAVVDLHRAAQGPLRPDRSPQPRPRPLRPLTDR